MLAASNETHCDNLYLITDFQREDIEMENKLIHIIPAYKWLLESN